MAEREQETISEITAIINSYFFTDWGEDRDAANEILNITDSKGNKLLGIIAEDQSLPKLKELLGNVRLDEKIAYVDGVKDAQQAMLNANFVKLVKE